MYDEAREREGSNWGLSSRSHLVIPFHHDVFTIEFRLLPRHEVIKHRRPGLNETGSAISHDSQTFQTATRKTFRTPSAS